MTSADIALQLVVTVHEGRPDGLELVLERLQPYEPKKIVEWTLGDGDDHALVGLYQLSEAAPVHIVEDLNRQSGIDLEWNAALSACATPNDPRYEEQWALGRISAEAAWGCAGPPAAVTAAVLVIVVPTGVLGNPGIV